MTAARTALAAHVAPLALALAWATAGCASPPEPNPDLGSAPANFLGFPALSHEGLVFAEAVLDPDHPEIFGVDLLREESILPVRLEVGVRGEGAEDASILLHPEQWELTLFLQDGTALRQVEAEVLAGILEEGPAAKVIESEFITDFLRTEPTVGYVFFQVYPEEDFTVRGTEAVHRHGETLRGIDLYHSLVRFHVVVDDVPKPFFVGLEPQ